MTRSVIEDQEEQSAPQINEEEFFGLKSMRWYQIAARNETYQLLKKGVKRILIVLPTGAGKTITVASTLSSPEMMKCLGITEHRPLRVLFVAHKHRLLSQAEQTFAAANNVDLMLQSMMSDIKDEYIKKSWDITVLDEGHHEAVASFQYQLEKIGDKPLIGLTATPERHGGELVKFEELVAPISREQAVKEGWLAPTQLYSFVDAPERNKVKILKDIFTSYATQMGQTMVFVRTKREVADINLFLQELGFKSIAVLSQTDKELDDLLNRFSAKEFQFICNCAKISEGVDVQFCESVVLGRTVASYPLLQQIIGRASRPDAKCQVYELINPLSGSNLDSTVCVGTPESHKLIYRLNGKWVEEEFNYDGGDDLEEFNQGGGSNGWGGGRAERTEFRRP